jgi:lycopene cyclase domain-containing protein
MLGSLAGPLCLSFDKKVAFYRQWKALFGAMILPALFYIIWDMIFTKSGVWSFNPAYITGIKLYNLPIEEVMFFFVVPYCCVFIYACIRNYFPKIKDYNFASYIFFLMACMLISIGILHHEQLYTFYTFILCGCGMLLTYYFKKKIPGFNISAFLISYMIILIPFLIVNGLLTAIPVVIYNNNENLTIRIHTIPVEDVFYGMLLILGNVVGYERLKV